ncbi:MAG: hypothetical protein ABSB96_00145 [Gaiellaceae bacterium]
MKRLAPFAWLAVVIAVVGTALTGKALGMSNVFVGSALAIAALVGAAGYALPPRDLGHVAGAFIFAGLSFQQFAGAIGGTTRVALYAADAIALLAAGAVLGLSVHRRETSRRGSGSGSESGTPAPLDRDRSR